ncbi:unnamed protein product, partial [Rotaria sordida]
IDDIITQPIIEVPTKIYSKTSQKLFDHVLFTKSLNNDVNAVSSDLRVFERVFACSNDNDAYSTCTSLVQPMPAIILALV